MVSKRPKRIIEGLLGLHGGVTHGPRFRLSFGRGDVSKAPRVRWLDAPWAIPIANLGFCPATSVSLENVLEGCFGTGTRSPDIKLLIQSRVTCYKDSISLPYSPPYKGCRPWRMQQPRLSCGLKGALFSWLTNRGFMATRRSHTQSGKPEHKPRRPWS